MDKTLEGKGEGRRKEEGGREEKDEKCQVGARGLKSLPEGKFLKGLEMQRTRRLLVTRCN